MIKASSLYYSLIVMLLVSLIVFAFFQLFQINNQLFFSTEHESLCINYCDDGLIYIKNDSLLKYGEDKMIPINHTDAFFDADTIKIKKNKWGLFDIFQSESICGQYSYKKSALVGLNNPPDYALLLANSTYSLKLAGKTILRGFCYLPEKGVERGNLTRNSYVGKELVYGKYEKTKKFFPSFKEEFRQVLNKILQGNYFSENEMEEMGSLKDSISRSFNESPLLIKTNNAFISGQISGHVVVFSSDSIVVSEGANLDKIILVAPKVIIASGFRGNLQIISEGQIIVQRSAVLEYPSVLCVSQRNYNQDSIYIQIEEDAQVAGSIISVAHENAIKIFPRIDINEGGRVVGEVISDGDLQLRGEVIGSVITRYFKLNFGGSENTNYLLDATIDRTKLPEEFCGIDVFEPKNSKVNELEFLNIFTP